MHDVLDILSGCALLLLLVLVLNRPPTDAALALAAELLGERGSDPVIDLDIYRRAIEGEQTA